ncbi:MoaA/NifB/PqqE/SkfB family radical SAM enzyme [Lachnotalea glycerini]|jgi:MoaA/NifB/PqqE/SkfB family radical SAM enzyme|uniref:MoaA/NifB/PqqE/SkfB family radical SAM enzyme n=1 Tax=Lachnotalea glycerini TaxID=1763509 RepID=A0A255IHW4_9FIRM|nr:radical SAM protein [Lachnotalea glycerini]PXV91576.1 MoaA/NifB/PqqE/SkfB family radical SAM enzyme [Lachnotalea glycerini]RDY28608.1 radical SAM protein [Lachnotalea glycerini]
MKKEFNLEQYMTKGVENIVKGALKASFSNPRESIFMAKYAIASKKSSELRRKSEKRGEHVPPFLIASITSQCNLHCAGCYARANHACHDEKVISQLSNQEWLSIFHEAKNMGIGFILLAGGEPLIRKDVLDAAATVSEILFPIFTNGTLIQDTYIELFDKNRNLLPVLSIEGKEEETDKRRGNGVFQNLVNTMQLLKDNGILFGASVTVTTANLKEVTSKDFLDYLYELGCKVVIYVEFVPVTNEAKELAPGDEEREYLRKILCEIRENYEDMVFVSFPGDEKTSGGCLAAGRGFFHISSNGSAEPCPFSPYSDINVKDTSLREAMNSRLFRRLQEEDVLLEEHAGGCVLFERKETVEKLLS